MPKMGLSVIAQKRYNIIHDCIKNRRVGLNSNNNYPSRHDLKIAIDRYLERAYFDGLSETREISVEQIDLDIRFLKRHKNAPIEYVRSEGGYHYTDSDYELDHPATIEELDYIKLGLELLKQHKFKSVSPFFKTAIEKTLFGYTLDFENLLLSDQIIDVQFDEVDNGDNGNGLDWMKEIYDAVYWKKCIEIEYKRHHQDKINRHIISPYLIKEYNSRYYVYAHSNIPNKRALFAFDRILSITKKSDIPFVRLERGFNLSNHFSHYYGVSEPIGDKPYKIELQVTNAYFPYLVSKKIHPTQQTIEKKRKNINFKYVQIECFISRDLENKLLSFGENVTVKSPKVLVDRIKKRLDKVNANYK